MDSTRSRDFTLGLVFFGGLALLLYYTVVLTGFSLKEKILLQAYFPDARGLKNGDAVLVAGRPIGAVREVEYYDDRPFATRIGVSMEFEEVPKLHEGYSMRISEFTVLGGRVVEIDPGPGEAPLVAAGAELVGTIDASALESLNAMIAENRDGVRRMIDNLALASTNLVEGRGALGALLNDEELRGQLDQAMVDVSGLLADLREGKGAVGALLSDEATRERVIALVEDAGLAAGDLREVLGAARDGEGLIGALLNDPTMREDAQSLLDNLSQASERLELILTDAQEGGAGLLGTLISDPALADDATELMANLSEVSRRLREGEGSLGRLLSEEEAYEGLVQALRSLNGQLEDAREAQPISTFTQLLFGNF